jgi:hypothetical protein
MDAGVPSDREAITATVDRWEAVQAEMAELSFAALTSTEVLAIKVGWKPDIAVRPLTG